MGWNQLERLELTCQEFDRMESTQIVKMLLGVSAWPRFNGNWGVFCSVMVYFKPRRNRRIELGFKEGQNCLRWLWHFTATGITIGNCVILERIFFSSH